MMRTFPSLHRLLAVTLLLFCSGMAFAEKPATSTPLPEHSQGTDAWMTYYYKNPQPERFQEEVRKLSKSGFFKNKNAQPPCVSFLSQILAQNPKMIAEWMTALDDLPEADKKVLHLAIAYSHTAEGSAFLKEKGLKEYQGKFPEILEMEVNDPSVLDMLWGHFMATGKAEPIRHIVAAFNLSPYAGALDKFKTSKKTEEDRKAAYLDATLQSACWSLQSNCKQHPRVQEICEALLKGDSLNPMERRWLGTLLNPGEPKWREDEKTADEKPNMKSKNGFGAQLFLTEDEKFFEDWKKPENPHLNPASKARRNVPLHTVLLFADPGLDADKAADVTADVKILKPDGSVYGEEKNTVCWKGKYAAPPHNLQLAQAHMGIRIEPKDPAGTYTVEVLVRDKVKKVELPLKITFEVPE